jgi:hypothetical protein
MKFLPVSSNESRTIMSRMAFASCGPRREGTVTSSLSSATPHPSQPVSGSRRQANGSTIGHTASSSRRGSCVYRPRPRPTRHVRDVLHVAPVPWISVLEPEDTRRDIGRHVLDERRVHRFCSISRHEDLHRFVVIAVGTVVERTLDACRSGKLVGLLVGNPAFAIPSAIRRTSSFLLKGSRP